MQLFPFPATVFSVADVNPFQHYYLLYSEIPVQADPSWLLFPEEVERSDRYLQQEDMISYRYRHHLLNTILTTVTGKALSEISFVKNEFGKPALIDGAFHFNISHTENGVALCFCPKPLGVDIEYLRNTATFEPVAVSQYHHNEKRLLAQQDTDETFLGIWTRKEALLKAVGTGLDDELYLYDCTQEYQVANNICYQLTTYHCEDALISLAREEDILPVILAKL